MFLLVDIIHSSVDNFFVADVATVPKMTKTTAQDLRAVVSQLCYYNLSGLSLSLFEEHTVRFSALFSEKEIAGKGTCMTQESSFPANFFKVEHQYQEIMKCWQVTRKEPLDPQCLRNILDCIVDAFLMDVEIRDSRVYWNPYQGKIILIPEEGFTAEYVAAVIALYRYQAVKIFPDGMNEVVISFSDF